MESILQIAGSLGVGAFLAVVIAIVCLRFIKDTIETLREDRKFMEDRLTKMLEEDYESRRENTKVLSELTTLVQRLNGKR